MLAGYDYASDLACSPWDFSVEIDRLLARGITTSDLRWLIKRGYLSHAREITGAGDAERRFESQGKNLAFFDDTCFVLTAAGLALLGRDPEETERSLRVAGMPGQPRMPGQPDMPGQHGEQSEGNAAEPAEMVVSADPILLPYGSRSTAELKPKWDRESRMFVVGEHLVKHFRVPSPNQAAVLNAFQEEGWPRVVDDPLPPLHDQEPKRRLRDTIKCLNQHQVVRVIRFRGDGTGQRVSWELLLESAGTGKLATVRRAA